MGKRALVVSLIITFWFSAAAAATWTGTVVEVVDGDIIRVSHPEKDMMKIMLYGVSGPEKNQPYFQQAKEHLAEKLEGQEVNVREFATEQKIVTAVIIHEGSNINEQVLQAGYGWVYTKYCDQDFCADWLEYQQQAKSRKLGLWQDNDPIPPWEWRKNILTKIFRIFLWILPPWSD